MTSGTATRPTCAGSPRRPDARHQPDAVRRRLLRPHGAGDGEGLRGDGRPGEGRDRQPGREPDGRPLLAPRAGAGPDAGDHDGDPRHAGRGQGVRRGGPRGRGQAADRPAGSPDLLSIGIGGSALGPMFVADALGDPADGQDGGLTSSTTPTPTASPACCARLGGTLGETLVVVMSKSGDHARDPQRHARRGRRLRESRPRLRQARRRRHRRRLEARPAGREQKAGSPGSRCGTGSAAGPARCRPSAWCRLLQGLDMDAMLAGAAAWTRRRACTTRRRTPPPCSP